MSWDSPLLGALRIEWKVIGSVTLDEAGKLRFPNSPSKAGIYQFRVQRSDGTIARYVGESDNLSRRFGNYRNPGPTQWTSLRVNALFKELLAQGHSVTVAIAIDGAWIFRGNQEESADLKQKNTRRLFENFVLVMGKVDEIEEINK